MVCQITSHIGTYIRTYRLGYTYGYKDIELYIQLVYIYLNTFNFTSVVYLFSNQLHNTFSQHNHEFNDASTMALTRSYLSICHIVLIVFNFRSSFMITQTASIDLLAHTFGSIEAEAKPLTEVSFCYVLVSFHPYGPILKKLTRTTNYRV